MSLAAAYMFGRNQGVDVSDLASLCTAEFDFEEVSGVSYKSSVNNAHILSQGIRSTGTGIDGGQGVFSNVNDFRTSLLPNAAFKSSRAVEFTKQIDGSIEDVPFIFSCWIQSTGLDTTARFIVDNIDSTGSNDSHYRFIAQSNFLSFIMSSSIGGTNPSFQVTSTDRDFTNMKHICVIYNGLKNAPQAKFYTNGINTTQSNSNNNYIGMQALNPGKFSLLNEWSGGDANNQLNAVMDRLQIFKEIDYSKADDYAKYLYNNGIGRLYPFN
tara:strand:- start:941 stop:1747 length:807 start_codon:yes stop_codon:yes gene_type:complete